MNRAARDAAVRLADLPVLTTRRACLLADCSRSTLQRSGPSPIGKRGRTYVYDTEQILAWMRSGMEAAPPRPSPTHRPTPRERAASNAIERVRAIARGETEEAP